MSHLKQAQYMFICTDWILRGEVILQGNILLSCLVFIPIAILFLSDTYFMLFNCWVMSNSLQPHGLQHARLACPSPTPGAYSNSCPLSRWCLPTVSSCRPLLPPSAFYTIKVFSNESALHIRWPKYWSFNFSVSPSNEYSGLISFRIDWFDLFAVQGTSVIRPWLFPATAKYEMSLWKIYWCFYS